MKYYTYDDRGMFLAEVASSEAITSSTTIAQPSEVSRPLWNGRRWVGTFPDKEPIHEKYNNIAAANILGKFSDIEAQTFTLQQKEWHDWYLDNNTATPCVDRLARARGVDREWLLKRIGSNIFAMFD